MATRNHQDAFTRGRAIGKFEKGYSLTSVASRAWKDFPRRSTAVKKVSVGRSSKTMASDDRYIVVRAKRDLDLTEGNAAQQLRTATGGYLF